MRPHLRPDGIPTRCDETLMTIAEQKITDAMRAVEQAGASESESSGSSPDAAAITDAVCLAALRGWCNYPPDADLSPYQQSEETKKAWRRAILAALAAIRQEAVG